MRRDVDIEVSIPCVACGYDLQGLRNDADCPECGRPVEGTTLQPVLAGSRTYLPHAGSSPGRRLLSTAVALLLTGLALILVWFLLT